jgi:hypothetical protein
VAIRKEYSSYAQRRAYYKRQRASIVEGIILLCALLWDLVFGPQFWTPF